MIDSVISGALTEIIVAVVLALLSGGGLFAWGRHKRNQGREDAHNDQTADTLDRLKKAQDAKRDRPADPDDAVRRNDGQW
jgi:flagellar basal body-associated protein FliL